MTDVPQWALERARELAAMWNDPGQGEAIARALVEAANRGECFCTQVGDVPVNYGEAPEVG